MRIPIGFIGESFIDAIIEVFVVGEDHMASDTGNGLDFALNPDEVLKRDRLRWSQAHIGIIRGQKEKPILIKLHKVSQNTPHFRAAKV